LILASGFALRIVFGATLINVEVSKWLYLTMISFSFFLSFGKRKSELEESENYGTNLREVLKYYNQNFLNQNMFLYLTLTIVFYSMWCVDEITVGRFETKNLSFTVPLVMVICMKYNLNLEKKSYGDPVEILLSDRVLIALIILYILIMAGIILL